MKKQNNKYEAGMTGQLQAEKFLQNKNYRILERNFRAKTGEIDLIAQCESYIVFIEVKYRRSLKHGYPGESVGRAKQQRLQQTALHYISSHGLVEQDFRFDVVEVLEKGGQMLVNHIENAFDHGN